MNTIAPLRRWTEIEPATAIADRAGVDRATTSRHVNGHAQISVKHMTAYLSVCPAHLRAPLLGAWLQDLIPVEIQPELLGSDYLPAPKIVHSSAGPDRDLLDRMTYLAREAMIDAELRRMVIQFCDWMGYDGPIGASGDEHEAGDVDPRDEHKTSTACAAGDVLSA